MKGILEKHAPKLAELIENPAVQQAITVAFNVFVKYMWVVIWMVHVFVCVVCVCVCVCVCVGFGEYICVFVGCVCVGFKCLDDMCTVLLTGSCSHLYADTMRM